MTGRSVVLATALLLGAASAAALDLTPPQLTTPAFINAEATGPLTGVFFLTSAIDLVDGAVPVICSPPSDSAFPIGSTTVDCFAADLSGNIAVAKFVITIKDTTPPSLSVPSSLTTGATAAGGATLDFSAAVTAIDAVDGAVTPVCTPASGSFFPIGTTTVTCSATDTRGNKRTRSFTISVVDTFPPNLYLPADITASTTSTAGTAVTFNATAVDDVSGAVPVTCSPASGSIFPIGTTTVRCTARDTSGNDAAGTFKVTVRILDNTAPTLFLPAPITVNATSSSGAHVDFTATAIDNISGPVPVSCAPPPGNLFPVATTTVTCTATDGAGNTAVGTFIVKVQGDVTRPVITGITVSDKTLWPPNHKMVPITIAVNAFDDHDST
ncbi:MAG TPA: HYR domain-containing protein, partial [Thermoanaerobaculia bacterium]|nr:HYR domain-containing protein [Thermoanaerobaculia bacterium]